MMVKAIPRSEDGPGVKCVTTKGDVYHISQNLVKRQFTLWKKESAGYEKIQTDKSPLPLYDKIPW